MYASSPGVGYIEKQADENEFFYPAAYNSRNLCDYENNYVITELEYLAIENVLGKFYHYLHGQKFFIYTNHAVLTWLKNAKHLRGCLFCWSLKLRMFNFEIKYEKGSINIEADMLSKNLFQ